MWDIAEPKTVAILETVICHCMIVDADTTNIRQHALGKRK